MKNGIYEEKDFADVVDGDDNVVGRAPKAWKGTDRLPPGHKIKGGSSSSGSSQSSTAPTDPNPVPAKSTSRADLEAYAVEHGGMTEEQAKGYGNVDELHAALVAAKAPKA